MPHGLIYFFEVLQIALGIMIAYFVIQLIDDPAGRRRR